MHRTNSSATRFRSTRRSAFAGSAACATAALGLMAWSSHAAVAPVALPVVPDGTEGAQTPPTLGRRTLARVRRGQRIFRKDTFGSEAFWGGTLRLHEAIAGAAGGGVGPGLSPLGALAAGLKVDVDALPSDVLAALRAGQIPLDDPAVTLALLQLDAVVGVRGFFSNGELTSVGITCALCHSTVDDSIVAGIGVRQDGWANRDLDVGGVISLAPDLSFFTMALGVDEATVRTVLASWGPGRFDAHLLLDGQAFRPDGGNASVLIPAAFGLGGVNLTTYTGWGSLTHWNALVGNLEMGGSGRFYDPRLDDPIQFPIASMLGLGDVTAAVDRVTPALADLQFYQLALDVPAAPAGSFDPQRAARGRELFAGKADCARCHVPPVYSEPGWNLHDAAEIGIDSFQADRSPERRYRTTPLAGLHTKSKGGYYHDGRFATLGEVVEHYDALWNLGLTDGERANLVEFLKSL